MFQEDTNIACDIWLLARLHLASESKQRCAITAKFRHLVQWVPAKAHDFIIVFSAALRT